MGRKRWVQNYCVECDREISADYERCYECNDLHNNALMTVEGVSVVAESDNALKLEIDGVDDSDDWYPKSLCHVNDETLSIPRWLAEKKELDYRE